MAKFGNQPETIFIGEIIDISEEQINEKNAKYNKRIIKIATREQKATYSKKIGLIILAEHELYNSEKIKAGTVIKAIVDINCFFPEGQTQMKAYTDLRVISIEFED